MSISHEGIRSQLSPNAQTIDLAKRDFAHAFGTSQDLEIATGIATETEAASHN
jgi:hypothetical protein